MAVADDFKRLPPKPKRRLTTPGIPWYRDLKVLRILIQIIFAVLFVGSIFGAFFNLVRTLRASDLSLDFEVYKRPFGPAITEGLSASQAWVWINELDKIERFVWIGWVGLLLLIAYNAFNTYRQHKRLDPIPLTIAGALIIGVVIYPPGEIAESLSKTFQAYLYPNSITRAIITGIYNTLRVVIAALFAATFLGIMAGVGLLSRNFLVRNISKIYVEIFRNTPLLVQLYFIYSALRESFPAPRQSFFSPDNILSYNLYENLYAINNRGISLASPQPNSSASFFFLGILIGLVAVWFIRRWRLKLQEDTGVLANTWYYALPVLIGCAGVGWLAAGGYPLSGNPFTVSYPRLQGANVVEGYTLSMSFFALFLGLTLYTAAFIADIVRAGIQSVSYGQIEAARSQGLKGAQVLNLVILPQALRLIIPPLGNQYVNMGKNSSLAIAVAYVDTFRAAQLANNETGQAVPLFLGLMLIYLAISLLLSFMTNILNRLFKIRTR